MGAVQSPIERLVRVGELTSLKAVRIAGCVWAVTIAPCMEQNFVTAQTKNKRLRPKGHTDRKRTEKGETRNESDANRV